MGLFQKTSSFDHKEFEQSGELVMGHVVLERAQKVTTAKRDGPSHSELEHWYHALQDIIARESAGDVDHTVELEDVRDGIYQYLY